MLDRLPLLSLGLLAAMEVTARGGLEGKVMCGYQGWFRTPADGTGSGWRHYSRQDPPGIESLGIELWPDVRELPPQVRTRTNLVHPDGAAAELFSSVPDEVCDLHFAWMRDYGIDGPWLQRFVTETRSARTRSSLDRIARQVQIAAGKHTRVWALMYDLSGTGPAFAEEVMRDWRHLNALLRVEADPAYLRQNGRPLIGLWGLGFQDREPRLEEWTALIDGFRREGVPGGCAVMVGVPTYWRTLRRDTVHDPRLLEVIARCDAVSPWSVGRLTSPEDARHHEAEVWAKDLAWCRERNITLVPVAFPGFSWRNLKRTRGEIAPFNPIPRRGGAFFWSQCVGARRVGAQSLYVAMFDELDEGTAIFKVRQDPPGRPGDFLSEPGIPEDQYLWLAGQAARMFRGREIPPETMPNRDAPPPGKGAASARHFP